MAALSWSLRMSRISASSRAPTCAARGTRWCGCAAARMRSFKLRRHPIKLVLLDTAARDRRLRGVPADRRCGARDHAHRARRGARPRRRSGARRRRLCVQAVLPARVDGAGQGRAETGARRRRLVADVPRLGPVTLARGAREVRVDGREVALTRESSTCSSISPAAPGRWSPATSCSSPSGGSSRPARRGRSRCTSPSCARSSAAPT